MTLKNLNNIDLKAITKSIAKTIIEREFPEELPFFDVIWEILEKRHADNEGQKGLNIQEGPIPDLGFASPAGKLLISNGMKIVLDEVLPNIIFREYQSKKEWVEGIKDLTLKVANEYNIHPAVPIALAEHLPHLLIDAYLGIQNNEIFEILIGIGSKFKKLSGDKTLVKKLRKRKEHYSIWIDKDKDEAKIFGENPEDGISDAPFKLLVLLLTNMGRVCTYELILRDVWKEPISIKEGMDKPNSDDPDWIKQRDRIMKAIGAIEQSSETVKESIERIKGRGIKLHYRKWKYCIIDFKGFLPYQ
ncbi:MAG: hypothetical protein PHU49_00450 [Syntrophorhabdaceae bacterium]|nr:hypothetical protein [Syntrophorhabdaceae bacterium]